MSCQLKKDIKFKDLTIELLQEICDEHSDCYMCPLDKYGLPCIKIPRFTDEQLNQTITFKINIEEGDE